MGCSPSKGAAVVSPVEIRDVEEISHQILERARADPDLAQKSDLVQRLQELLEEMGGSGVTGAQTASAVPVSPRTHTVVPPKAARERRSLDAQSAGTSKVSKKVRKPRCVISYQSKNEDWLERLMQVSEALGFEAWNGKMVDAAKNWVPQWIEKVEDKETRIVVLLLSPSFCESTACQNEFHEVMSGQKHKAVPIMLEEFLLPKEYLFHLRTCNYIKAWSDGWINLVEQSVRAKMLESEEPLEPLYPEMPLWGDPLERDSQKGQAHTADDEIKNFDKWAETCMKDLFKDASADHTNDVRLFGVVGGTNFKFSKNAEHTILICETLGRKLADLKVRDAHGKSVSLALVTGGRSGVGAVTARAFHRERLRRGCAYNSTGAYSILPVYDPGVIGKTAPLAVGGRTVWVPRADGSEETDLESGVAAFQRWSSQAKLVGHGQEEAGQHSFGEWPMEEYGQTWHIGQSDRTRSKFLAKALPIFILIEGGPGAGFEAQEALSASHLVIPLGCLGGSAKDFADCHGESIRSHLGPAALEAFNYLQEPTSAEADAEALAGKVVEVLKVAVNIADRVDAALVGLGGSGSNQDVDLYGPWRALPPAEQGRTVTVLPSDDAGALAGFIREHGGHVVLVDGHGRKNQFRGMSEEDFAARLLPVVARLDRMCGCSGGERKWVAMSGGDPYDPEKAVDAAFIVHTLHKHFGVTVIATQVACYGQYMLEQGALAAGRAELTPAYKMLQGGAVMLYETKKRKTLAGEWEIEYGGHLEWRLVGASKFWFHRSLKPLILAQLVMGGGPIAMQNAEAVVERAQKPILYVPCAAKFGGAKADEDYFGEVHALMEQLVEDPRMSASRTEEFWELCARRWKNAGSDSDSEDDEDPNSIDGVLSAIDMA